MEKSNHQSLTNLFIEISNNFLTGINYEEPRKKKRIEDKTNTSWNTKKVKPIKTNMDDSKKQIAKVKELLDLRKQRDKKEASLPRIVI